MLVKVFLASGFSKEHDLPLTVSSLEVLDGVHGDITFTAPDSFALRLPGFQDPFRGHLSAALAKSFVDSGLTFALGQKQKVQGGASFLQDDVAGSLQITCQGFISPPKDSKWFIALNSGTDSLTVKVQPTWLDGLVPDPNALVQMLLTFSTTNIAGVDTAKETTVKVLRIIRPLVRLQILSLEPATQRIEVQIVFRQNAGTPLAPGTRTALYLESTGENDPFIYMQPRIRGLIDSGLPLDLEAQETTVVDVPAVPDQAKAVQASSAPHHLNQWSLFAWPATPATLNAQSQAPTCIRSDKMVTLRPDRPSKFIFGANPDSNPPPKYRLAAELNNDGTRRPLFGAVDASTQPPRPASFVQPPAKGNFPQNIHFLPDQMIVDDAVFHWFNQIDERAARQLYVHLQKLDKAPPQPLPPGFVPERLPDPHSDRCALELRPFGETKPTPIDLRSPLPGFGTDAATWLRRGGATANIGLHILAAQPPANGIQQRVGGITVALGNGRINIYLPPNADCELTLRSVPTEAALRSLALARLLEELEAQLQSFPSPTGDFFRPPIVDLKMVQDALSAVKSGRHPMTSPGVTIRLRHMTARPARPPATVSLLMAGRLPGATKAVFDGRYRLDRPSTGAVLIQAAAEIPYEDKPDTALPRVPWEELLRILPKETSLNASPAGGPAVQTFFGFSSDDLRAISSDSFTISKLVPIDPSRISAATPSSPPPIPQAGGEIEQMRYEHDLGDTRHRTVYYRPLAVSRFDQFFPEAERMLNPCPGPYDGSSADQDAAVRWDRVEIPATTRPHPPVLHDQNVVFEFEPPWGDEAAAWKATSEGWVFLRSRRSGVRLWLERPWYSSGSNETLGVVCWGHTRVRQGEVERYLRVVSRWGTDPIFEETVGPTTDMGVIVRDDFTYALDDSPADLTIPPSSSSQFTSSIQPKDAKDSTAAPHAGAPGGDDAALALAVHQPKFHPDARLWFCDIFIRPRRYTPHISLSVVRYQPFALPSCAVSESVRVDWMQIQPPRTMRLQANVNGTLRIEIVVTGTFPASLREDRRLILCRLERFPKSLRPANVASANLPELGWKDVPLPAEEIPAADLEATLDENEKTRRFASESARRFLPGLPLALGQTEQGVSYKVEFEVASSGPGSDVVPTDEKWTADDAFRISLEEYELYPAAYQMTEGRKWLPRLIYSEQAHLPLELIRRFVSG